MKNQTTERRDYTSEFVSGIMEGSTGTYIVYGAGILAFLYFSRYLFGWGAQSILAWKALRRAVREPV